MPSPQSTPSQSKLGEADESRRPSSSDGLPRQPSFTRAVPSGADTAARVFAAAVAKPAQLRREQRLCAGPLSRPPRLIASWQRAPGLETWRVPRSMVIIEPEGQEQSNPEEPRLKWAAQDHQSMGKIITVAPGLDKQSWRFDPRHRQRVHGRLQTSDFP